MTLINRYVSLDKVFVQENRQMNSIVSVNEGKIALHAIDDIDVCVDVVYRDETFWMTQKAIAELFDVNVPAISKHIRNVLEDDELEADSTVSIWKQSRKGPPSPTKRCSYKKVSVTANEIRSKQDQPDHNGNPV
jgi:hypothetical protein